jgi:aminopeptidase YwaD
MRRVGWLFALVTLGWLSLGWGDLASYKTVSTTAITAAELKEHVRYLASDELQGRGAGTEGAQKARDYIAALFASWGLKPMGDDGTYFQRFSFQGRLRLGDGNALALTLPDGTTKTFQPEKEFLPLALSANGEVDGEIVFVGYGLSAPDKGYDDYEGISVQGKIVLALRGMPANDPNWATEAMFANKLRIAREKGAKAIILVAGPQSPFDDEPVPFWNEPLTANAGILAVTVKRAFAEALLPLGEVQKRIDETRKPNSFAIPNARVRLRVNLTRERLQDANVLGLVEGSDPKRKNEIVVIGAHYDHMGTSTDEKGNQRIFHGADDNASGTAGLLELAQFFAAHRDRLHRSLLFIAFGAEERGLIGSLHFVNNPTVPLERIVAMVNLDMIGRLRNDTLYLLGRDSSPVWAELVNEVNRSVGFTLRDSPGIFGASDHFAFYNRGIPVLFFFTGMHENYHRPSDTWDTLNYEGMERLLHMAAILIERIANLPERPPFQRSPQAQQPSIAGARVSTGIVPDYGWEGEGVKLLGVRPGSPAEKAGLKAGDIIVEVAGKTVRNIYDYTAILSELQPDKPVPFVILRGNERLTITVVPEAVSRRPRQ